MPAFETAEYQSRVRQTSALMAERGIDLLVVLVESNICYLTGYDGRSEYVPQALLLRAGDTDPLLILREMDLQCAIPTVYMAEERLEGYPERLIGTPSASPWDYIAQRAAALLPSGTVGVELSAAAMNPVAHGLLETGLKGREIVNADGLVNRVRVKKSPAEINYMRQAGVIVDAAVQAGIETIAEGVRECDVGAVMHSRLIAGTPEFGGGYPQMSMGTGDRGRAPHLGWTDRPMKKGENTLFEVGAFRHQYCCALSRTVFLGTPTDRIKYVHDSVLASFLSAEAAIKPGATTGEVYAAFARVFGPTGVRKESRIGYSIGLNWGDLGFSLQADDTTVLQTDYTLHLIIGIWERQDGYILSETFRVGETKGEPLTRTPRQLFVR